MAKTTVADLIVPEVFEGYAIERTAELSAFGQSGIIEHSPEYDRLAEGGGREVNMPFLRDLSAPRQILSSTIPLNVNLITAAQDVARIHTDAQAWSVNSLAGMMSGTDPMQAIIDLAGGYWARIDATTLIACLRGIFASNTLAGNLHKIAAESIAAQGDTTRLNGLTFVDATQKLGDRGDRLTSIAVHSAVEASLRKQDLIQFVPDSQGKSMIKTFQGRRVVVDDSLPARDGGTDGIVYTSYLFGQGAFAKGAAQLDSRPLEGGFGTEGVELSRQALASDTNLINRRRYILHPRGVRFTSASVTGDSPSNEDLANGDNWERVWETKNVRIVAIEHN